MKFEGLLAALEKGNVDFVVAGMVATPERLENADFSKSYYQAEQSLLVKAGKGQDYKNFDDLKGLKVGVQKSTVQEKIAQEKIENPTIKSLSKITDLVLELKNDKIEGVVLVKPVAKAYADANEDLEVAEVSLGKEAGVAIALKKDSPELLAEMNKTLDKLLAENKVNQFINDAIEMVESN